jgi:outer membrane immunogenic protein
MPAPVGEFLVRGTSMKKLALAILIFALSTAGASAADMAVKAPPMAAPVIYSWTGFYIGGNVGYGWGQANNNFVPLPSPAQFVNLAVQDLNSDPRGVIGGGQIGYNWQNGKFVYGLEADIQGADVTGRVTVTPIIQNNLTPFPGAAFLSSGERLTWFGTVRGRVGITPVDRLLLYVTGGFAYGNVDYYSETNFRPVGTTQYLASFSKTKTGWTLGAGGEWAVGNNWSVKAEYLYIDLGNENTVVNANPLLPPFQVAYSWRTQEHIARVGLNYKWGGPVVARY